MVWILNYEQMLLMAVGAEAKGGCGEKAATTSAVQRGASGSDLSTLVTFFAGNVNCLSLLGI